MPRLWLVAAGFTLVAALGGCVGSLPCLNQTVDELHADPDPAVRAHAARTLGEPRLFLGRYKMHDTHLAGHCLEHLRRALDDKDGEVSAAAQNSMTAWWRWLQDNMPREKPGHNPTD
jgi:hypothetical protein